MMRSLVAAFVALAATTSAFTVSPLASHHNGAAVHAGRTAPLSMAENNADKIRYVMMWRWSVMEVMGLLGYYRIKFCITGHIMCSYVARDVQFYWDRV